MARRDIIVIGASAGGVEAVTTLVRGLPAALRASLFVAVHFPPHATSALPGILARAGPLPAAHAQDGEAITPGRIYVAPPDRHLLVLRGRVRLSLGPRENGYRPAIDALFRSASRSYGARVIGVVLSGALDDGTVGLQAIKQRGGLAVVQDPSDALCPTMPSSALQHVAVDCTLPASAIPEALVRLMQQPLEEVPVNPESEQPEEAGTGQREPTEGLLVPFSCPDCGGSLWETREGRLRSYECRVGHRFSEEALLSRQDEGLETALWVALRALAEKAAMTKRLAERYRRLGHAGLAARFERQRDLADTSAGLIRSALHSVGESSAAASDNPEGAPADVEAPRFVPPPS